MISFIYTTNSIVFVAFGLQFIASRSTLPDFVFLIPSVIAAYAFVWLAFHTSSRYSDTWSVEYLNLTQHREKTIDRLKRLLAAAGLNEQEIFTWLEKVPAVPA